MRTCSSICLTFLFTALCQIAVGAPYGQDDVGVRVAYLKETSLQSKSIVTIIVEKESLDIRRSASIHSAESVQSALPGLSRTAALDLLAQVPRKRDIVVPLGLLGSSLRVLQPSRRDVRRVLDRDGGDPLAPWKKLSEQFQGASRILGFSDIGYSEGFDQAVFFVSVACAGLCGSGELVFMRRSSGGWKIVKVQQLWIS